MTSSSFKDVINKMCLQNRILCKKDWALNKLQWLVCHKTKLNLCAKK